MKQIVLLSRIHRYGDEEEFSKYTTAENHDVLPANGSGDPYLLLIRGSSLRHANSIPDAIYDVVDAYGMDKDADTIVAYHYESDITSALQTRFADGGWKHISRIEKYGSADERFRPLYEILDNLGGELRAERNVSHLVERLWNHLAHDALLEAKLRLLQSVVNGETRTKADGTAYQLDPILEEFQAAFDDMSCKDVDIFGVLQESGLTAGEKQQRFDEYREAFERFRDSLDIYQHVSGKP